MTKYLVCVGCGERICRYEPGATLAMSCQCGAGSPILLLEGTLVPSSFPASILLQVAKGEKIKSHIEYYLGYSQYSSFEKEASEKMLRSFGAISENECEECITKTVEEGIRIAEEK